MVRVGCGVVFTLMAANAGCRQSAGVVVVGVARSAGHGGMRAGQRERGVVVVKGGARPVGGRVAGFASRRESGGGVIRVGGAVVVRLVAAYAGGRQRTVVGCG